MQRLLFDLTLFMNQLFAKRLFCNLILFINQLFDEQVQETVGQLNSVHSVPIRGLKMFFCNRLTLALVVLY